MENCFDLNDRSEVEEVYFGKGDVFTIAYVYTGFCRAMPTEIRNLTW